VQYFSRELSPLSQGVEGRFLPRLFLWRPRHSQAELFPGNNERLPKHVFSVKWLPVKTFIFPFSSAEWRTGLPFFSVQESQTFFSQERLLINFFPTGGSFFFFWRQGCGPSVPYLLGDRPFLPKMIRSSFPPKAYLFSPALSPFPAGDGKRIPPFVIQGKRLLLSWTGAAASPLSDLISFPIIFQRVFLQ